MVAETQTEYLRIITDQRTKCRHWRFCHYDSARFYRKVDSVLGLPSVILSTIILGFAFYTVGNNIDIRIQITLASLSVLQGVLLIVQLYLKPTYLAENHRNTADKLGDLGRQWASIESRVRLAEGDITMDDIERLMKNQDAISHESEPVPRFIIKRNGLRPNNE